VKKTELKDFANVRSNGINAINLKDDDSLISVKLTDGNQDILIGASSGLAVRFHETDVRSMGRTAAGVKGISLGKGEQVISMTAVRYEDAQVIVVGEKGYGKRTRVETFRKTKRGAKGVIAMKVTEKTGPICAILEVTDEQDLVVMTEKGVLIRQPVKAIRELGRNAQGVKLLRLDEGDEIADITTVTREEDELPEVDQEILDNNEKSENNGSEPTEE
jgi:DNA gyrase subunit A